MITFTRGRECVHAIKAGAAPYYLSRCFSADVIRIARDCEHFS